MAVMKPQSGGGKTGSSGLPASAVAQLAQLLGISPAQARKQVVAWHKQHGGSWQDAVMAVYKAGGTSTGGTAPSSGGGGGGGGGGSSSGGGGGGGGGGSSGPSPQQIANAEASYANLLSAWGIPLTPGMQRLIQQAVSSGMGSAAFLATVRKTKAYAQAFPGIMNPDGTMKMTEAQYISGYQSARNYAASLGRNLSLQAYGMAIRNGNSPAEIQAKLQALDVLKSNADVFNEFGQVVQALGLSNKPPSREDMLRFIMKQGPQDWERVWQDSYAASQLNNIGITVGQQGDVSVRWLDKAIKEAESLNPGLQVEKLGSSDYAKLAQQVASVLMPSQLYKEGITKKDMVTLFYGGKGAAEIAQRAQRALATYQARFEPQAEPQSIRTASGQQMVLTGAPIVQQTE